MRRGVARAHHYGGEMQSCGPPLRDRTLSVVPLRPTMARIFAIASTLLGVWTGLGGVAEAQERQYERVSPSDTNGYPVAALGGRSVSPAGDRVAFRARRGPAPGTSAGVGSDILQADRRLPGWASRTLVPPVPVESVGLGAVPDVRAIDSSLRRNLVETWSPLTPDAPVVPPPSSVLSSIPKNLYMQDTDGTYHVINSLAPGVRYEGANDNFTSIVFSSSRLQVDSGAIPEAQYLYEWNNGKVVLASVLPDGSPQTNVTLGGAANTLGTQNAVSGDGRRIFFHEMTVPQEDRNIGPIYVREAQSGTRMLSASQRSVPDPNSPLPATFLTAEREHGRKALFSSCEKLTDDSTAVSDPGAPTGGKCDWSLVKSGPEKSDLYLYDLESGTLSDLTKSDPAGADLAGVIGASADLDVIYFVARGVLAPGALAGALNIYVWDHGQTRLVAQGHDRVVINDDPLHQLVQDLHNWHLIGSQRMRASRVSDNGRYLVFTSRREDPAYDNSGPGCPIDPVAGNQLCSEVYRYDAVTGELGCLSCPTDGGRPAGDSQLMSAVDYLSNGQAAPARSLLEDGTVYFESPTRLLPEDGNGAVDVYEFRNGVLSLISDGTSAAGAEFADASASGNDVFITTAAQLVRSDSDALVDLYDARVGGGFPDAVLPSACVEDSCQGGHADRPSLRDPGTAGGAEDTRAPRRRSGKLVVERPSREGVARLAAGRVARVVVRVSGPGRVSVAGHARIGGRQRIVLRAARQAGRAGSVSLPVRLSRAALNQLNRRGALRIAITVRAHDQQAKMVIRLKRPPTPTGRQG